MSQYRDDQEAARHRLESLEEKLAARDAELEQHKNEIAERDREISRLARELRSAGTARIIAPRRTSGMRFMVAGAMSAAIVAGMLGFLSVRRAAIEPAVTFADLPPPTMPLAAPRVDATLPTVSPPPEFRGVAISGPSPNGSQEEEAELRRIEARIADGEPSRSDLMMLKAICAHLGHQACHDRAAARLRSMQEGH